MIPPRLLGASLLLASALACTKVPLTAPTSSTIVLSASSTTVPINGTVEIGATVTEQAGTAVQNGTLITFNTTLGSIEPREARTHNGRVTVTLIAGPVSGTAQITAQSGGAKMDKAIEIKIEGITLARLELTASPTTVPSTGGTSQLIATAVDTTGNRMQGLLVFFSADAGTLATTSVASDQNGEARTSIAITKTTKVIATAGGGGTGGTSLVNSSVTLQVNALPTVTISAPSGSTATEGQPTAFIVTVTPNPNGSAVRDVTVAFGDGSSSPLGTLSGSTSVSHVYSRAGTYTITATVTDAIGDRTSSSTVVTVGSLPPLNVTIAVSGTTKVQTPITFVATVTPSTAVIDRYEWSFGDGTSATTSGSSTSHVYGDMAQGQRTVTVRAVAQDGRSATGRVEIFVAP